MTNSPTGHRIRIMIGSFPIRNSSKNVLNDPVDEVRYFIEYFIEYLLHWRKRLTASMRLAAFKAKHRLNPYTMDFPCEN